jgi:hypothetical protein
MTDFWRTFLQFMGFILSMFIFALGLGICIGVGMVSPINLIWTIPLVSTGFCLWMAFYVKKVIDW